ncbi:MAG: DUF1934 family protein [Erysipelotrichaceae bacterium]|jgi:hypothetical protein|nr:DUF1934 domain-containing protein [Erysipelotrichaceae bacterium]
MEIRIIAKSYNILNDEEILIKDGKGYLFENKLSYLEDEGTRNEVSFNENEILIERVGNSIISLKLNEYSTSKVTTVYGELILDTYLIDFNQDDDIWFVEYKLFLESDLIGHFKVIWEIEGLI